MKIEKEIAITITFNCPEEFEKQFTDYLNLRLVKKINKMIYWTSVNIDKLMIQRSPKNAISFIFVIVGDHECVLNELTTKINKKIHKKISRSIKWFRFWYKNDVYINAYLLTSKIL